MKNTKRALFTSVMALILCFSMLVGTTFAWFTDEVKSGMNQIVAGNLDVELLADGEKVDENTKLFDDVKYWEPGAVVFENLTVQNAGTLALKWQMGLNFGHENDLNGKKLSDVLQIAILDGPIAADANRADVLKAAAPKATSLAEFYMNGELAAAESKDFAVVIFWQPGDRDNDYNMNNGKLTSDNQDLHIEFGVRLQATQMTGEMDSFGNDYDNQAPFADGNIYFRTTLALAAEQLENGALKQALILGNADEIHANLPAGFAVNGNELSLKVSTMQRTQILNDLEDGAVAKSFDIHIGGVAEGNAAPAIITIPSLLVTGLSELKLELYHVENGVPVAMKLAATPANHNEFSYDSTTGNVTVAMATFSEVMVVVNPVKAGEILVNATGSAELADETVNEDGALAESVEIAASDAITAEVPAGVKLAEGATELKLGVVTMPADESEANITLNDGEVANSLNIHIEGVAEDNAVPMIITLPGLLRKGLNSTSVALYHVENGVTVPMTLVTNPTNHNEFSYDPATGDVVMCVASFSEYVAVTDDFNKWEGGFDTSWYSDNGNEFVISNEEQFAGFGKLVDEGKNFKDKTVKLGKDLDLQAYHKGTTNLISFNPIGCGYVNGTNNSNSVTGRAFEGTFDGQNHVIRNLYQNGWDLGLSYCTLGGGLFASVHNATIQNLTMVNANIVMECVEQGVIAGLAQGDCNFININIYGCSVANYQRATGGVVGEVSWGADENGNPVQGNHVFTDINVDSTTVVGSLWGDFDAPVGGVIGGYWDDGNNTGNATQVVMKNVNVACRLDVYNDVTSTYQWYAYRRAGMLIGNTDRVAADGRTADASFLTCEKDENGNNTVTVRYGDWRNYHYCEFNNHEPRWPFVRVEAGENCTAFSNPRWGVPNGINGVKVTPENHSKQDYTIHQEGDDCYVLLQLNQLYGGGQGVYGAPDHDGVTTSSYAYTIQYVNDNKLLAETFVESNEEKFTIGKENTDKVNYDVAVEAVKTWLKSQGYKENEIEFGGWVNAGSTKVTEIPAGTTGTIKLYPYFHSPYTARFVDQNGNVLAWCLFHSEKLDDLENKRTLAESQLKFDEDFSLDYWEVHITDENGNATTVERYNSSNFANYATDVTVYPVYKYEGDVNLTPVDDNGDGTVDYYAVKGYGANTGEQELVEIPAYVNGKPVTTINADAFSSYDDLHSVRIPGTIEVINSQSFTAKNNNTGRDQITMYFEGDPEYWNAEMTKYEANHNYMGLFQPNWDNNMGDGSRVFFLDENGKVINTMYWELNDDFKWVLHKHAYTYEAAKTCAHGEKSHYEYGGGLFGWGASLQEDEFTNYGGSCTCKKCNGAARPDAEYWTTTPATTEE